MCVYVCVYSVNSEGVQSPIQCAVCAVCVSCMSGVEIQVWEGVGIKNKNIGCGDSSLGGGWHKYEAYKRRIASSLLEKTHHTHT